MPTDTINRFAPGQIDTLISALEAMIGTLEEEHQALNSANSLALENIAERKANAVETISCLYDEFKQGLGLNGDGSADPTTALSLTSVLNEIRTTTPQLADRLDQLVVLTRTCRQSNQDNGTLVNLGLHNCQANLNLLQGLSQPVPAGTYGPQAQPDDSFKSLQRLQLRA